MLGSGSLAYRLATPGCRKTAETAADKLERICLKHSGNLLPCDGAEVYTITATAADANDPAVYMNRERLAHRLDAVTGCTMSLMSCVRSIVSAGHPPAAVDNMCQTLCRQDAVGK